MATSPQGASKALSGGFVKSSSSQARSGADNESGWFHAISPDGCEEDMTVPMSERGSEEDASGGGGARRGRPGSTVSSSDSDDVFQEDDGEGVLWWSTGLFDCHLDISGCVHTCCCCPCALAATRTAFNESPYVMNLLCALAFPMSSSVHLRHEVRVAFDLDGYDLKDLFLGSCCGMCSVCQLQRELEAQGGGITCGGPVMENAMGAVY